ncbi:MAG TPA: OmpA family protein [Candidatus Kapabacteria bacterium]|jgi:outer membrane protein OmpA-like peptidoglycan-associated protein
MRIRLFLSAKRTVAALCAIVAFLLTQPVHAQHVDHAASLKHARAGFEFEQEKEYQYALFEYDTAAKLDPTYPYPVERIGGMYQELKNYPRAIEAYERTINMDSTFDVYAYYNLGLSFRIVSKFDSAVWSLRQFIGKMDPINHADSMAMVDADWWIKFDLGCIVEFAKPYNTDPPVKLNDINSTYDDFGPTETADGSTLYFTSTRPGTNIKEEIETKSYGEDLFETHRDTLGHWTKVLPLPAPLNSKDDEGTAFVTADGQTMYLSLCRRPDGMGDCDIYESHLVGDVWTRPLPLGHPLNSQQWDANPSVTADGSTMYFSSTRMGSINASEDLYVSYKNTDGSWTVPKNLGEPINTKFNERSPFISADGKSLYFSSNGHPGFGNHDLFMSRHLNDGTWSVPVNLGRPINAYGDDVFLTIPASGDKIIYSTQRDNARGPLNLFEAKLPLEFRPGPVTLVAGKVYDNSTGLPVGAEVDVNDLQTGQRVAVYHANKVTGKFYITLGTGKSYGITATQNGYAPYSDHYTVPDTISYKEITHDLPLTPIPGMIASVDTDGDWARNHPSNIASGPDTNGDWERNHHKGPDTTGEWERKHPHRKGQIHHGRKKYPPIDTTGNWARLHPLRDTIGDWARLHPGRDTTGDWARLHPGRDTSGDWARNHPDTTGIELHNVFFDFDKATLRPESHSELNYWVDLLKKYPQLKIEIDGHTDSVGTLRYNERLSLARAEAVKAYLVERGIKSKRLVPKGFGATRPKATNETDEGRQRNRRTEFRFIR